jgi:hypothetical protein
VRPVCEERLRAALPPRAGKVLNAIREIRGGRMHVARFGARMRGEGPRSKAAADLFELHCRRLGFERPGDRSDPRGPAARERTLFDGDWALSAAHAPAGTRPGSGPRSR